MLKMAVIGDKETCLPFRGVGVEGIVCEKTEEVKKILRQRFEEGYGVIFIAESLAAECLEMIEELTEKRSMPIITIIPDFLKKSPGITESRLKNWLRRAVGIDISKMRD